MNIGILGAGTVGASIARVLCARHHNVFIIDQSQSALAEVEDRLDVPTIHGNACDPAVLFHAMASTAELCLALTNSDEVNIVGASIARQMGTGRSMSRIQHPSYLDTSTINIAEHFGLASLFSLEKLTALALARALRAHGLFALENLAQGEVEVQQIHLVQQLASRPNRFTRNDDAEAVNGITARGIHAVAGTDAGDDQCVYR